MKQIRNYNGRKFHVIRLYYSQGVLTNKNSFVFLCIYVYMCVCVCEREREREREGGGSV